MRMLRAHVLVAVLMSASAALWAQAGAPAAPAVTAGVIPPDLALDRVLPVDPTVRQGTLDNGLRFFIRRNTRPEARVTLRLAVDAGSMQEELDQRGLAHFLEHMAFNGTEHFKPGELVAFLESIGARFGPHVNASTSFDETIYLLEVPTDREGYVDKGLLALRDFAAGVSLLPAEVDKERGVVLEEWRGRLGASSRITDQQLPVLLNGSRYADRLPIGTPEVIKGAPRERLAAFYQKWYRPDQMAVVVVGDLQADEAERLVRAHFSDIPRPTTPVETVDRSVPSHAETLYSLVTDPEAQGWTVTLGFKSPVEPQRTVGDYRASLVRQLISQMIGPRLDEIARRPNAPFVGAEAGIDTFGRSLQLFEIAAAVPENGLAAGLEAAMVEARRVQQFGFNPAELDRARRGLLAFYERAYNERGTTESRSYAGEYVRHFLEDEPIPGIEFEYRLASAYLPTVTVEEASRVARALVTDGNRVVLAVAPDKPGTTAPTEDGLEAAMARAMASPLTPWADETAGRTLVANPPAGGTVTARRSIDALGVTVLTLSNGVEVWMKPTDFKNDQVIFSAYARGGTSLAPERDFHSAELASSLVGVGGRGGFSPVDLSKMLAGRIATASPRIATYAHEIGGSATPRDIETALQLNYLAFTAPNLTPDSFELLKRRLGAALENQAQNPRAVFGERVSLVNTSNHYSARMMTPADIPSLSLEAMQQAYRSRFANAADFTYFFVGAFQVAELTPLVEKWLGGLPSTGTRTASFRDMGVRFPSAVVRETVIKGKEPASQTVISFFADAGNDELEMHRVRAAASILSIRLREILREQLGGTYGVSVGYENSLPQTGYGAIVVQFGSAPENVDTLSKAVFAEVERLKGQGPSPDDVNKVKEMEKRDLETNARQNQYWVGSLQTVHEYGWDPTGILRRPQRTDSLTPELLHGVFKKYFPMDRYTVVTLKPEA
ncbi:MAG TPA: insulinase family protein [Vicinamibacterales bacterium]|nr:insulinase family protein [Vicinamibacterales bacterium]